MSGDGVSGGWYGEAGYYGVGFDSDEPACAWWTCSQQCMAVARGTQSSWRGMIEVCNDHQVLSSV
jgi:hypothetical protein